MTNIASISRHEASELRRDLKRLRSDIRDIRSDVSSLSVDAIEAARTGAAKARHRVDHTVKAAGAKGRESVEAVEEQIGEHPLVAIAAAFIVGMGLAWGLARKM